MNFKVQQKEKKRKKKDKQKRKEKKEQKKKGGKKKKKKKEKKKKEKENCLIFFTGTIYLFTGVIFDIFHARKFCFHVRDLPKISRAKRDFHAHF